MPMGMACSTTSMMPKMMMLSDGGADTRFEGLKTIVLRLVSAPGVFDSSADCMRQFVRREIKFLAYGLVVGGVFIFDQPIPEYFHGLLNDAMFHHRELTPIKRPKSLLDAIPIRSAVLFGHQLPGDASRFKIEFQLLLEEGFLGLDSSSVAVPVALSPGFCLDRLLMVN